MEENKHVSVDGRVLGDDGSEMEHWHQADPFLIIGLTTLTVMPIQIFFMTFSFGRLVEVGVITLSLFIDYGYRFTAPNHDTGSSRFTMPYMCLAFLFVSSVPFKRFTSSACSQ